MLIRLRSRPVLVLKRALGLIALGILSTRSAMAQSQTSRYWDGNGTTLGAGVAPSGTWGSSLFWNSRSDGTGTPTNASTTTFDSLYFSAGTTATGTYTVSVSGARSAGRLVLEDGTISFSGGTISLGLGASGTGISLLSTAGNATIGSNLTITGAQTLNAGTGRTLALTGGTFTRNAGASLVFTGAGTFTSTKTNLSVNNAAGIIGTWATVGTGTSARYATFSSGSTIGALTGTATATAADLTDTTGLANYDLSDTSGSMAAAVALNTLRYTGAAATTTLGATSFSANGLLRAGSGIWTIAGGALTIGADQELVIQGNANIVINSAIQDSASGSSSLLKLSTNTLTLTANNGYTGATTVSAGTLALGDGTTNGSLAGNVSVGTGATFTMNTADAQTHGGAITGAGSFTKTGAGTLTLSGSNSVATTTLNAGTLIYTGTNTGATNVNIGTLELRATSPVKIGDLRIGNLAGNTGTANVISGTYTQVGDFSLAETATSPGIVNQSGGSFTLGSGAMLLVGQSGSGTYNLSGGTLTTASSDRYGVLLGVNNNTFSTFNLSGTGTLNASNAVLLVGRGNYGAKNTNNTYNQTGGTATVGTLMIGGPSQASSNVNSTFTLTGGTFSAANFAQIALGDADTATLSFGGTATVTLPAFPTARGVGTNTSLTLDFAEGGYLAPAASTNDYMPAGTFQRAYLTANGANLNTNGSDLGIGQVFEDKTTGGKFIKSGLGLLTLSGANTYSGITMISGGTLALSGSGSIGTGGLNLGTTGSPGVFDLLGLTAGSYSLPSSASLAGVGTISGSGKTLAVLGSLAPGNSAGTITVGSGLSLDLSLSGSSVFDITSPAFTAGTFDLVSGDGSVVFGGILDIAFSGGSYAAGTDVLQIFANAGGRSGNFSAVNATGLADGQSATFNPATGTISVVPEPSTCVVALAGLACGGFSMWRRRKQA